MVYFIKRKSEVLEKFKELVNYANNSRKKLNILRSDNRGEYCSMEFNSFLKEKGITHQTTIPHNSAPNGVAEQMNRMLLESTCAMMSHADIPDKFWAEAVNTATYVRNQSLTTAVKEVTKFECFCNCKPDVSNLQAFGCTAYAHIPANKQKKLQAKSSKCIFMGYLDGRKGFKLHNSEMKAFIKSHDMIFDEMKLHSFDNQKSSICDTFEIQSPFLQVDDKDAMMENIVCDSEHHHNLVGETYEETFMQRVANLNPRREQRPPGRFNDEIYLADDVTADINAPKNIAEAWSSSQKQEWIKPSDAEYGALMENGAWELVAIPNGKNVVGSKWIFKSQTKGKRFSGKIQGSSGCPRILKS